MFLDDDEVGRTDHLSLPLDGHSHSSSPLDGLGMSVVVSDNNDSESSYEFMRQPQVQPDQARNAVKPVKRKSIQEDAATFRM